MFWNLNDYPSTTPSTATFLSNIRSNIPISRCSAACEKGFKKQLIKVDEVCCWTCSRCEFYEYVVNETLCVDCGLGRLPNKNKSGCYEIKDFNLQFMRWSTWYVIIPCTFASIGICVAIFVIVVFVLHNDTPVVKASGRELSYMLLCAIIICYIMTFVLVVKPSTLTCAIKRTGIGFGFSLLYSAMLIKTNRIYRIFASAKKSAKKPRFISPISQVFLTAIIVGVQMLGSFIWLIIKPPGLF